MKQMDSSRLVWRDTDAGLTPILVRGEIESSVAWAPQAGSQVALSQCPVFEALIEGDRGGGKTDGFLFSFCQHVGKGYGAEWRGILFRRTYPQLEDVIKKCRKWIPAIWPEAVENRSEHNWTWPDGETLYLRHLKSEADYWNYHGHNYPWIGFEELCTWPDDKAYTSMFACARSTRKGIPIMVRATANPYGVGHNWVKLRFGLPIAPGRTRGPVMRNIRNKHGELMPERVAIHSHLKENKILLTADPGYLVRIKAAAKNEAQYQAWVHGNWDIVAGGMFDDVWSPEIHLLPNFPLQLIPRRWYLNRAYDHGSSAPFSVGWWAQSNGEPLVYNNRHYGTVRGDLIRVAEWYGWEPNEPNVGLRMAAKDIAIGIRDREDDMGIGGRVRRGPADTNIWDDRPGYPTVAEDMVSGGVTWDRADKGSGSRVQGWEQIRKMLKNAARYPREDPGLFVLERCAQFRRVVPTLSRGEANMDDIHKDAEDHIGDEVRYRLRHKRAAVNSGVWK